MSQLDARTVPADPTSRAALRPGGLDYRRVDASDQAALDAFIRAVARGFIEGEPSGETIAAARAMQAWRRLTGVYDASAPQRDLPVATIGSWVAPLTIPGGELPMWAISEVTVAPTHRRRGIARAMIEGELRAAASAGVPVAGLTVSEATIYGRYGFGAATWESRWTVDTRRAGWGGFEPEGRVQYIDGESLAETLGALHERTRETRCGEIPGWPKRWREMAGVVPGDPHGASVRGVRCLDADGVVRGAMAYRIVESEEDWARSRLEVRHLVGETADARAALWRFALQHDLVGTVTAGLRPVDEALPWLIGDSRAVTRTLRDHGWLRILDVPGALEARSYAAPLSVVLRVEDPLGFARGDWLVEVGEDGGAEVTRFEAGTGAGAAAGPPRISLGVAELSSLYLGGVPAATLAEAGRVRGEAEAVAALDAALRTERAPHLSIVY